EVVDCGDRALTRPRAGWPGRASKVSTTGWSTCTRAMSASAMLASTRSDCGSSTTMDEPLLAVLVLLLVEPLLALLPLVEPPIWLPPDCSPALMLTWLTTPANGAVSTALSRLY